MRKNEELVYPGKANTIEREILLNGQVPAENATTITRVGIALSRGATKLVFYSDDPSPYIELPDANWVVKIDLANASLVEGKYQANIILYDDADNAEGLVCQPFKIKVLNV